jgi:hypothetical protein
MLKWARTFDIFSKDFHDGVMKFQEYMIHQTSVVKGKDVDDLQAMKMITDKIKKLEERQSQIYLKFLKVEGLDGASKMFNNMDPLYKTLDEKLNRLTILMNDANLSSL